MKKSATQIKPFLTKVLILYPLKTLHNQKFSGVFWGYKMGAFAGNVLKCFDNNSNVCNVILTHSSLFVINKKLSVQFISRAINRQPH